MLSHKTSLFVQRQEPITYQELLCSSTLIRVHVSMNCPLSIGRPKKCAQCVQCAQCGPPITALRTEQDQKLAAQCACHEAPTVPHPPPRQQTWLGLPDENLFGLFCRIFTGLVSLKRLLHFYVIRYLAYLYSANSTRPGSGSTIICE